MVNYVDNSRPVEKFGVAYYSWLEATVRERRFSGCGRRQFIPLTVPVVLFSVRIRKEMQ